MSASKARKTVLAVEIPRDELAFRIAQKCLGMTAPPGMNAKTALDAMCLTPGAGGSMGASFRAAADAAAMYFFECVNAGKAPN